MRQYAEDELRCEAEAAAKAAAAQETKQAQIACSNNPALACLTASWGAVLTLVISFGGQAPGYDPALLKRGHGEAFALAVALGKSVTSDLRRDVVKVRRDSRAAYDGVRVRYLVARSARSHARPHPRPAVFRASVPGHARR